MAKCVVLHSTTEYSEVRKPALREILRLEADIFAAVGVDCSEWEEAMDWQCIELDTSGDLIHRVKSQAPSATQLPIPMKLCQKLLLL